MIYTVSMEDTKDKVFLISHEEIYKVGGRIHLETWIAQLRMSIEEDVWMQCRFVIM